MAWSLPNVARGVREKSLRARRAQGEGKTGHLWQALETTSDIVRTGARVWSDRPSGEVVGTSEVTSGRRCELKGDYSGPGVGIRSVGNHAT